MVSCAVRSCSSRRGVGSKKLTGITFHRFPKDPQYLDIWIRFINRGVWRPSKYSVLCSRHFEEKCFDRRSLCYVRLTFDAIPTLHSNQEPSESLEAAVSRSTSGKDMTEDISLPSTTTGNYGEQSMDTSGSPSTSNLPHSSFPVTDETPRKRKLRAELNKTLLFSRDRKKKLISLRRKLCRREKRIASIKLIVTELRKKNYKQEEYLDIIAKLGGPQELYLRQLKKSNKKALPRHYFEELRAFALTLHY